MNLCKECIEKEKVYLICELCHKILSEEDEPKERWKPGDGEKFWHVNINYNMDIDWGYGGVLTANDAHILGNCFKTKEQAEEAAGKVKDLLLSLHN